jgi:hypothetical protein
MFVETFFHIKMVQLSEKSRPFEIWSGFQTVGHFIAKTCPENRPFETKTPLNHSNTGQSGIQMLIEYI